MKELWLRGRMHMYLIYVAGDWHRHTTRNSISKDIARLRFRARRTRSGVRARHWKNGGRCLILELRPGEGEHLSNFRGRVACGLRFTTAEARAARDGEEDPRFVIGKPPLDI